jgi:hypothetical protein
LVLALLPDSALRSLSVEPIPPRRPMTIEAAEQSKVRNAAHKKNFLCLRAAQLG